MREKLELKSAQSTESTPGSGVELEFESCTPNAPVFPVLNISLLPKKIGDIELVPDAIVMLFHE